MTRRGRRRCVHAACPGPTTSAPGLFAPCVRSAEDLPPPPPLARAVQVTELTRELFIERKRSDGLRTLLEQARSRINARCGRHCHAQAAASSDALA